MGFTQITFLFAFLPFSILIYAAAYRISEKDSKVCNMVLICESLVFLWWAEPKLLLFFVSLSILMYIMGSAIYRIGSADEKQLVMILSVTLFAFLPVIYKWLPSLKLMTADEQQIGMPLFTGMLVPVGIAFITLGAISYVLDIYMDKARPGNITDVFLYALLFPKAVCGPVVLWRDFSTQIDDRKTDVYGISDGLKRIIVGYARKAIIADTFAAQIALIDAKMAADGTDSLTVWILGLLYLFRIYYDFAGYSDIAIGLLRIFGFDFGENFDRPYLSPSLADFWRRWHISLGSWFREYIYIPLGGSRTGSMYLNILITFMIAAMWHGWRLNVLLWGALNGLIVIAEKALRKKYTGRRLPRAAGIVLTVLFVYFSWLLFRAPDLAAAGETFKALFISPGGSLPNFTWQFFMTRRIAVFLVIAALGAFGAFGKAGDFLKSRMSLAAYDISEKILLLLLFAVSIMFVVSTNYVPFMFTQIP